MNRNMSHGDHKTHRRNVTVIDNCYLTRVLIFITRNCPT